jgi:hypothetical protein
MNYFEYTVEVEVTEEIEKKTKVIFDMVKDGRSPFNIYKISDEPIESDKNKEDTENKTPKTIRTFTLTSLSNINGIVLQFFSGDCAKFLCFYKTPVIMF